MQLIRQKNSESVAEAIKHIFEFLNGVSHTIWFENDIAIVKVINLENGSITRIITDRFQRFKLHYKFKELLKKEHYVLKQPIIDLHFKDINELNQLPPTSFECTSVVVGRLDNYGRLISDNRHYYYLEPSLVYQKVQVKRLLEALDIYYEEGKYIMTVPKLSGKPGIGYINCSPYIRLFADKLAAIYNFSFLDLFEGNSNVIEKITKFDASKLQIFLFNFTNLIDRF